MQFGPFKYPKMIIINEGQSWYSLSGHICIDLSYLFLYIKNV